ncbi:hypothetical protein BDM02DRAFT_3129653 [Thelephora ganbajun]|uniref:Uncharacterized protein n=1 Tax=Thelephora ganbajun TaxID=370292 RepID=A0ACB6ZEM4_THEGA|nr:hypothetical protein BDM02DRAFT_3129653 [Thelephora ganbajun]
MTVLDAWIGVSSGFFGKHATVGSFAAHDTVVTDERIREPHREADIYPGDPTPPRASLPHSSPSSPSPQPQAVQSAHAPIDDSNKQLRCWKQSEGSLDSLFGSMNLYHEAINLAEKLREQQRQAEELKKLVKELEALERQLRALQDHCDRVKREAKEREEREKEESKTAEAKEGEA